MSPFSCPRESELRMLLDRGQWPLAFSEELRAHVAACRSCAEVALVKQSFWPRVPPPWLCRFCRPPDLSGGARNSAAVMPPSNASENQFWARRFSPWE